MSARALAALPDLPPAAGLRRGVMVYRATPFIDDTFTIRTRKKSDTVAKGSTIIDGKDGEVQGETTIAQVRDVDAASFVKVYSAEVSAMADLSRDAHRCFLILFQCVQQSPNTDTIDMDLIKAQETFLAFAGKPIPERSYFRGMKELQAAGIVAASVRQGWFFINPAVLFNGDRVRFLTELRKAAERPRALNAGEVPALTAAPGDGD